MSKSLISFFLVSDVSESLRSFTKNEQMSESLIFLSESLLRSFWAKNKRFAQKRDERIPSPAYNFVEKCVALTFSKGEKTLIVLFPNLRKCNESPIS